MFESISKLRFIFGVAVPVPTVLNVEPAVMENRPSPAPCLKLSQYWIDALLFWEGYRPYRYLDSKGYWTVGIGVLLGTKPAAEKNENGDWVPTNDPKALSNPIAISKLGRSIFDNIMSGAANDPDLHKAPGPKGGGRNGNSAAPGSGSTPFSLAAATETKHKYIADFVIIARNSIGPDVFDRLPYAVKCVLVVMTFQLGDKLGNFKLLKEALAKQPPDFQKAAAEMQNSGWWNDTQPDRKEILQTIMRSGGNTIPTQTPGGKHKFTNVGTAKVNPCGSQPSEKPARPITPTIPEIIEMVGLSGGPIMPNNPKN